MDWSTAAIGLKDAAGEESLVHEWRVEQLERLGLFSQFAGMFAATVNWHAIEELVSRGCPSSPSRGPLVYECYISHDCGTVHVFENDADSEAVVAHHASEEFMTQNW